MRTQGIFEVDLLMMSWIGGLVIDQTFLPSSPKLTTVIFAFVVHC